MNSMLQPNEIFQGGDGKSYQILSFLGQGRTGDVYHALLQETQTPVALKVMREGVSDEAARRFVGEADNLLMISSKLHEIDPGLQIVPSIEGSSHLAPQYLALELVSGKTVIDLVVDGNPLKEKAALKVSMRFALLLDVLHTRVGKTYADMKFENIWWLEGEEEIRVTDWNVIADYTDTGRAQDMSRFTRYMSRMFLGSEPNMRRGIVLENISDHPRWGEVSVGVQQILRKAFHFNQRERYETPAELLKDLKALSELWDKSIAELGKAVDDALMEAQNQTVTEKKLKKFLEAEHHFDVYRRVKRMRPGQEEDYRTQIRRGLDTTGYLEVGLSYFDATDYDNARENFDNARVNFEQGSRKATGDLTIFRRWLYLTETVIKGGSEFAPYIDSGKGAVHALNVENYDEAIRLFKTSLVFNAEFGKNIQLGIETLQSGVRVEDSVARKEQITQAQGYLNQAKTAYPEFASLVLEAYGWDVLKKGHQDFESTNYKEAQLSYGIAEALFKQLPHDEWRAFVPDLKALRMEADNLQRSVKDAQANISKAQSATGAKAAIAQFEQAYSDLSGEQSGLALELDAEEFVPLWTAIADQAYQWFEASRYQDAFEMFEFGIKKYPRHPRFQAGYQQIQQVRRLEREDVRTSPLRVYSELLNILSNAGDFSAYPAFQAVVQKRLMDVVVKLMANNEFSAARRLLNLTQSADQVFWQNQLKPTYDQEVDSRQRELYSEVQAAVTAIRQRVRSLAKGVNVRPDLFEDIQEVEKDLDAARGLALSSPDFLKRDSLMDSVRGAQAEFDKQVRHPWEARAKNAGGAETMKVRQGAFAAYEYANQLQRAVAFQMREIAEALYSSQPVEWFAEMKSLSKVLLQVHDSYEKAELKAEQALAKMSGSEDSYAALQKLQADAQQAIRLLDNEAEDKKQQTLDAMVASLQLAEENIKSGEFESALQKLDAIKGRPELNRNDQLKARVEKAQKDLERRRGQKYLPTKSFWIAQSVVGVLLVLAFVGGMLLPRGIQVTEVDTDAVFEEMTEVSEKATAKAARPTNTPSGSGGGLLDGGDTEEPEVDTAATEQAVADVEATAAAEEAARLAWEAAGETCVPDTYVSDYLVLQRAFYVHAGEEARSSLELTADHTHKGQVTDAFEVWQYRNLGPCKLIGIVENKTDDKNYEIVLDEANQILNIFIYHYQAFDADDNYAGIKSWKWTVSVKNDTEESFEFGLANGAEILKFDTVDAANTHYEALEVEEEATPEPTATPANEGAGGGVETDKTCNIPDYKNDKLNDNRGIEAISIDGDGENAEASSFAVGLTLWNSGGCDVTIIDLERPSDGTRIDFVPDFPDLLDNEDLSDRIAAFVWKPDTEIRIVHWVSYPPGTVNFSRNLVVKVSKPDGSLTIDIRLPIIENGAIPSAGSQFTYEIK